MDIRSPINIATRFELYPRLIDDYWFTETALFSRLRETIEPFGGGLFTKSVFRFRPLPVASYKMGASFTIVKVPTLGETQHGIKYYVCNIPEFKEEIQVINKGPEAVFSLIDEDLENGLSSITNKIAISWYGDSVDDETELNGLGEGIGDGVIPNWRGKVVSNYAGVSRTGNYGSVLNGNIYWFGNSDGSLGGLTFRKLNEAYNLGTRGRFEPNLITMSRYAHSLAMEQIEPQYRFSSNERDPYWGGNGFRFRNALVVIDEYAPSAKNGLTDAENYGLGNFKTGTITNPLTGTPKNNFPNSSAAANLTVGEVIHILNTDFMRLRISDDDEYGFGFSGFMQLPDSTRINGQIKAALNGIVHGGRYQTVGYGIG